MADVNKLEQCILDLYEIGGLKFGNFTLKSGIQSPVYFDLRTIVAYPKLMVTVSELIWDAKPRSNYDQVCGVPYTALPIATIISVNNNLPMLIRRKESKGYGTKKLVEGVFEKGQTCIIIEDVIVSGSSVYETVDILKDLELEVSDAVVFLDRQQGGKSNLRERGINIVSVIDITQMINILLKFKKIDQKTADLVIDFIKSHNNVSIATKENSSAKPLIIDRLRSSFSERATKTEHPVAKKLFNLMTQKKTNLCVAADVKSSLDLFALAEQVGPYICILKTHIDMISDFSLSTSTKLKELALKYNFILLEDRKFADIGNTVTEQYNGGVYEIAKWADLVTVHTLPGHGIIKGLEKCLDGRERGCVLISQMSSDGSYSSQKYTDETIKLAEENQHFVIGFIAQNNKINNPGFLMMTPGLKIDTASDNLGQKYLSPEVAVLQNGTDIIIVGRGITQADDPSKAAKEYKEMGYNAYLKRISSC